MDVRELLLSLSTIVESTEDQIARLERRIRGGDQSRSTDEIARLDTPTMNVLESQRGMPVIRRYDNVRRALPRIDIEIVGG